MEKNDYEQNILIHNSNSNNIEEKNDNSLKDIEEEFKCINDEIIDLNNNNDINGENLDIKNTSNSKEEIKIDDNEDKNIIIDDEIKNEINQKEKENSIIFSPREINDKNDNLNIPDNTKFGIDKSGNPVEITKKNKNELIAFIIQEENKENYLIDIKGNILQKTEDDYFRYKNGEEIIIIKNFDVKNPELRIYGHRKINFDEIKKNFDEKPLKENNPNLNKNSSFLITNEKENEKIDNKLNNTNININTTNAASRNKSAILDEKNSEINIGNINFKNQMELWRKRYGKNNEFLEKNNKNSIEIINNEKPLRKFSYKKIDIINNNNNNYHYNLNKTSREKNNELVTRTDSILKMASIKSKNLIPHKSESNFKKLNNSKKIKSITYNRNYSYTNIKENNYGKNILRQKEKEGKRNKRKIDIEYINNKYNNYTTELNLNKYNEEEKNQREILLQNIKAKYTNKINNNSYLLDNSDINSTNNNDNDYAISNSKIDDYIYSNLSKINYIKKNKQMKCTVLKTEVGKIISNFNYNYHRHQKQQIPENKKGEKLFFEYGNEGGDVIYNKKIKIIPSKIRKNKFEVYNNNFDVNNSIKLDNKFFNNNYYRKIKHNKY